MKRRFGFARAEVDYIPIERYKHLVGPEEAVEMPEPVTAYRFEALEMIAARFRIFSEPVRLRILVELGDLELTASQVADRSGTSQPNASRQLAVLLNAGLVARRKDHLNVRYRVVDPTVIAMFERVCSSIRGLASSDERSAGVNTRVAKSNDQNEPWKHGARDAVACRNRRVRNSRM